MKTDEFVPPDKADTMVSVPAVMLIVNWNCFIRQLLLLINEINDVDGWVGVDYLQELLRSVIDSSTPEHSLHNRSKVIMHEDNR